jgi:hypothetical protein
LETFEVISPAGGPVVRQQDVAPRLDALEGKTIGEVWNGVFKGDQTFPLIRQLLKERIPGIRIVPYTEFPFHHGGDNPSQQKALAVEIAALAKEKGCDAIITGNGA